MYIYIDVYMYIYTSIISISVAFPICIQAGRLGVREETGPTLAPPQITSERLGRPSAVRWGGKPWENHRKTMGKWWVIYG